MKAIVTVIGKDQVGITAAVCSLLAQHSINILDISQTILQEYFTMVMLVDTAACDKSIVEISQLLEQAGQERGLSIRIQRETLGSQSDALIEFDVVSDDTRCADYHTCAVVDREVTANLGGRMNINTCFAVRHFRNDTRNQGDTQFQ